MMEVYRRRRLTIMSIFLIIFGYIFFTNLPIPITDQGNGLLEEHVVTRLASKSLDNIEISEVGSENKYERSEFGSSWAVKNGCDTRNVILVRDLKNVSINNDCEVTSGILYSPYSGESIKFSRGQSTSSLVQIDHVVALSDAWQKGAEAWSKEMRIIFANDPLELIAVDRQSNQSKSDGDAADWLPANKLFRCQYVARQIAVKSKYDLWLTSAEYKAIKNVLNSCPNQLLPSP